MMPVCNTVHPTSLEGLVANVSQATRFLTDRNFSNTEGDVATLLRFTDLLLAAYPWLMFSAGTVTNVLSFIVLTRPKLKKSSTFFYLSMLSLIDLILIYTFCINFIALYQFGVDLQLTNIAVCKLYAFLIYFLPQFSAWTCAAVSLDRVVGGLL